MIITELIKNQVYECLIMLANGLFIGFLREIFICVKKSVERTCQKEQSDMAASTVRKKKRGMAVLSAVSEIAFWILAGIITCAFLYYCCYGQLSFHNLCALCIGALLWKKIFYGIIDTGERNAEKKT